MAQLIALLVKLGPKLPEIWPDLIAVYQHLQNIWETLHPEEGGLALRGEDPEIVAAEAELVEALSADGGTRALFDGGLIRGLLAFAKAHPELISLLVALIRGK